ncbi:MAG: hypothetical protein HFJ10_07000 [Lachnospiraceae bacterium]|nr:hypothetical protein [Lachnospiraceae bacterium]
MMASNRTNNVIKNSFASLRYIIIQILVQLVIRTAFIHILGNEYTGVSGLFTDILQVLSMMEMGLDSSMVYALYKPLAQRDEKRISALLSFYEKAFNIIGIIVLITGILCTPFLDYIVNDVPNISENIKGIFLMYVVTTAFSYFLIYRTVLLRADQQARVISDWSSIIFTVECLIEVILLIIFQKFYAYLIVHLVATILRNLILSKISIKRYPNYFGNTEEKLYLKEKKILYRDLACLTVYNLSGVVINSTDSIFVAAFVGTVEVAIISNFTLIINSLRIAINHVVSATKSSIGNLVATTDNKKQEIVFNRMNFISFWITCFCCTCLMVLLNPFVGEIWFGQAYKISNSIIKVLVANFFIAVMVFPVESFRNANGLFVQGWFRPAVMTLLNIVLDFFMGKRWGMIGIFLATTISRTCTQVWYDPYLIYKQVFKKSVKKYFMNYICYILVTIFCCFTAATLCDFVTLMNRYINFICRLIIAIVVPNIYVYVCFHRTEEFSYCRILLKKLKHKLEA